jgi:hypothetical protein
VAGTKEVMLEREKDAEIARRVRPADAAWAGQPPDLELF